MTTYERKTIMTESPQERCDSKVWSGVIYPIVQVLRPVSPLAWFPRLLRATASRASLSAVRRRSVSRLSHSCLPLASANSSLRLPM